MIFKDKIKEINKEYALTEEESLDAYNSAVQDVVDDEDGSLVYNLIDALGCEIMLDETGYHITFNKKLNYYKDCIYFKNLFSDDDEYSIEDLENFLNYLFLQYYEKKAKIM